MELLTKQINLCDVKMVASAEGGYTFSGYASVFNEYQGDSYGDVIAETAYDSVLAKVADGADMPLLMAQHNHYDLPIGKITSMEKDDYGLKISAELTKGNSESENYRAALLHGTIKGLSIGYRLEPTGYEWIGEEYSGRLIKDIAELSEVSIVSFAAQQSAKIDLLSVKSSIDGVDTVRKAEKFLRDELKCSREAAKAIISQMESVFSAKGEKKDVSADEVAIKMALKAKGV